MKRLIVVVTIILLGFSLWAGAQATQEKPAGKAASAAHPLDINTATKAELEQVPGLAAYADKIIEGRPYKTKSELVNRSIVPMTVYDKVKARLVARGPKAPAKEAAPAAKPKKDEAKMGTPANPLDINSATKEDLEKIPGLGNYADKIIAGRPYKTKSELVNRSIVPMTVYNRVKDRLVAHAPKAE